MSVNNNYNKSFTNEINASFSRDYPRACMMRVDEALDGCQDRRMWKTVVFAYSDRKKVQRACICIIHITSIIKPLFNFFPLGFQTTKNMYI